MSKEQLADQRIRALVFHWLATQCTLRGSEMLPIDVLRKGFIADGQAVPLIGPQGIFKPRIMTLPLSITTAPAGPYDDTFESSGLLLYRYRGTDPQHRDNVGLRTAMKERAPLVYFHGIARGKYLAAWPVFIVGDSPKTLTFAVAVDSPEEHGEEEGMETEGRRSYITTLVKRRVHQQHFRERVLAAYNEQCACCRLRQPVLLEAAHIIPDTEPGGEPVIPNGISLCCLHHAAYDGALIGISPSFTISVQPSVLRESDGVMLRHGLQGLDGQRILLPKKEALWPDRDRLAYRYELFRRSRDPSLISLK